MTSNELCWTGVLGFITTGAGRKESALDAHCDADDHGQNFVRLNDIPV